jgi:hypothetical protein
VVGHYVDVGILFDSMFFFFFFLVLIVDVRSFDIYFSVLL